MVLLTTDKIETYLVKQKLEDVSLLNLIETY